MNYIKYCFLFLLFVASAMLVAYFPMICDYIGDKIWKMKRRRRIRIFCNSLHFYTRLISVQKPYITIKIVSVGNEYAVYKVENSEDIELHTAKVEYLYDNYTKLNEYGRN